MTDGLVLPPRAGRRISGAGMTLKVGSEQSARWSAFEAEVAPGFDVGAHRHAEAEEIFYIRRISPRSSNCGPAMTSSSSRR